MTATGLCSMLLAPNSRLRASYKWLAVCGRGQGLALLKLATDYATNVNTTLRAVQEEVSQAQIVVGMLLIVLSQAVQACQITCEDYFLSNIGNVSPTKVRAFNLAQPACCCARETQALPTTVQADLGCSSH